VFQISRTPFTFRGVVAELRRTFATEGVRGLFRGNLAQVLRVYPYSGIQLAAFDVFSGALLSRREGGGGGGGGGGGSGGGRSAASHLGDWERVLAGAAAGAVSVAATYPLDILRARLAVAQELPGDAPRGQRGLAGAARALVAEGGLRALYRGLLPTLVGILPYAGISFATYEALKARARALRGGAGEPSAAERLAAGGAAGLAGQAVVYPLDTVRRRLQTEGCSAAHAHLAPPPPPPAPGTPRAALRAALSTLRVVPGGVVDVALRLVETEGVRGGLFKGISMNAVKGPLAVGVSFTIYDGLKALSGIDA